MAVHVECDSDDIEIACAFAIAKQGALDAIGASQQAELGGSGAGAAVIVGVQGDDHGVAMADVAAHPFDLISMNIGQAPFDGVGQVEDDFFFRSRLPNIHHGMATLEREVEFGIAEAFG